MNTVSKVKDELYAYAASRESPVLNPVFRQELLDAHPSHLSHFVLKLLFASGAHGADFLTKMATRNYRNEDSEVVGIGHHSVAIKDGDVVTKYHHRTLHWNEAEREKRRDELRTAQGLLTEPFYDVIEPQDFSIQPFIGDLDLRSVTSRQSYVDSRESVDIVTDPRTRELLARVAAFYSDTGVMVDWVGSNNIMFRSDGYLLIVDTVPLIATEPRNKRALTEAEKYFRQHGVKFRPYFTQSNVSVS
jgi:hypothetical protein